MPEVLLVIMGPVAALLGVWLGSRLNAGTEAKRWRRETKMAAYRSFLRVAHEAQTLERELLSLAARGAPDEVQDETREKLVAVAERMELESAELQLVASPDVAVSFLSITGPARPTTRPEVTRRCPPPDAQAVELALAETSRRHACLVIAMQSDLGLLPREKTAHRAAVEAEKY